MCLGACSPKHSSYSDIATISEEGWIRTTPIYIKTEYADSTVNYDMSIILRHDTDLRVRDMYVYIDYIKNDSVTERELVKVPIADEYGRWKGSGFGTLYQTKIGIRTNVKQGEFQKIALWNGLDVDTLKSVKNIGIILEPK